ncbi:MAG: D-2-hydroxyacid dehydrogenase [Polyangiales bacterium]
MKIVVLDAHTLNPGDLSWAELTALGACEVHGRTEPDDVLARAADAEIVLTNKTRLRREQIAALPKLRYVGVLATGYDVVDIAAAAERGVVVTNVPSYGTASVAQMTFALLLELCNHVGLHAEAASMGRWSRAGEFSHRERPLVELDGLTLSIVGLGRIGRRVAEIGAAFGMHVLGVAGRSLPPADLALEACGLDAAFARADVLSLHCPLTAETARMVDARRLSSMKRNALLINTARGALIDEVALVSALQRDEIAGAALDVLAVEPPPADHPLLHAPRCLVTPHIAWATYASRARLLAAAVDNVRAFLAGAPRNVVSR